MSESSTPPPPPPPLKPPAKPADRGVGWFFAITGGILVVLTLGCVASFSSNSEDAGLALVCGSPTLLLGGLFLWLGTRRLKR
jgi:hypothetical protein